MSRHPTIEHIRQRTVELAQLAALGLLVCTTSAHAQTYDKHQKEAQDQMTDRPLEQELRERSDSFKQSADQDTIERYQGAIEALKESGALDNALGEGDTAPNFELPSATGETVSLESLLEDGPVVLTFYRGGWCPYCNIQLRSYQHHLDQFKLLGASLVAISPEKPDNTLSTQEKNELDFAVLSDSGNEVADDFGLRYEIDPRLVEKFGPLLEETNADDSHTLPLTATFVIDPSGTIRYANVTADYKLRAEPADIIKSLELLEKKPVSTD